MISVTVVWNKADIAHYKRALTALTNRVKFYIVDDGGAFNRRCASLYSVEVFNAIMDQRFASQYRDYVARYKAWKNLMGLGSKGFGILGGDLLNSLTHYRDGDGWFGGIAQGAMDSGGKSWYSTPGRRMGEPKPISMYAYVMEYGGDYGLGGVHPARPVFTPVGQAFADTTWVDEANNMLESIARQWA